MGGACRRHPRPLRRPGLLRQAGKDLLTTAAGVLFRGEYCLDFDQIGFHYSGMSVRRRMNLLAQGLQLFGRSVRRFGYPPILQIEPVNACNLQCPACATGNGLMKRPPRLMPFRLFRKAIDEVSENVLFVALWSWGEPFLNPEVFRMIRYAADKGLMVHTSTNGHFLTGRDRAGQVVESGLNSIVFALDGLDQGTYGKYRRGGDFGSVVGSIRNLVTERTASGATRPFITVRFMVMKHNEHQAGRVVDFAMRLGVDAVTFRSAALGLSRVDLREEFTPSAAEFRKQRSDLPDGRCGRPYANLTIFSNGDVVACENDYNSDAPLGNVSRQTIREILSGPVARKFLGTFRSAPGSFTFCESCETRLLTGRTANIRTFVLNHAFLP